MNHALEFLPDAMLDVEEAFLWYQAVSQRLSERFQVQLELSLNAIQSNPQAFHLLNAKARCKKLKGFPYLVVYAMRRDVISIIAVIHERKNPTTWKRRIKRR